MSTPTFELRHDYWIGRFTAMGSPCEVLIDTGDESAAHELILLAQREALRIEQKYSRYRDHNIVHRINTSGGIPVQVDDETARLIEYADQCYRLTDGKFDITSGVLRRAWKFDGSDRIPTQARIEALLSSVGWDKATWASPVFTLPAGMEIDFGGIAKEYAVDKTAQLLHAQTPASLVVNYGGDLYITSPRANGEAWRIGVDDPHHTGQRALGQIPLARGGLCTSGDSRRFLLKDGVRYGHILNPKTGWPVTGTPRSVTVLANTCIEAGMLATFAMLEGERAEEFLKEQQVKYWVVR